MKKLLLAVYAMFVLFGVSSATTSIKLSLYDKIASPSDDSVHGLELGIGTYTPEIRGVALNFIYSETNDGIGWQAGIVSISKKFEGLQTSFINLSENFKGAEYGLINLGDSVSGIQCGFFNKAQSISGLQLGLVNMAENISGIQIGFINFIKTGKFPVMVIFNAKF
ncbi:MAG: hypothetical protein LBT18_05585 [Endomicrobium sp.]|jgi:hypothetical protein|nr:hypothetical protein [Endomicrobium sp.]